MLDIPNEILGEVAATLDNEDLNNFGLVSTRFRDAKKYMVGKRTNGITVYPQFASMSALLAAVQDPLVAQPVHSITIIGEDLKCPDYGYETPWEELLDCARVRYTDFDTTDRDVETMRAINDAHYQAILDNGDFTTSGMYREMLTQILKCLHNLTTVTVRWLEPGEQIPGWSGVNLFKELSFYRPNLDTREVFYGDWQYDALHRRKTMYWDEYGELIMEPDAGPQASFKDDLKAAVSASGTKAKFIPLPIADYQLCSCLPGPGRYHALDLRYVTAAHLHSLT